MIILYIDDDDDDLKFFSEAMDSVAKMTCCLTAGGAGQALKILKFITPDLIFLDINMPGMSGKDLLKKIRADQSFSHVPIVIYSTTIQPEDARMYKKIGADHCLTKASTFPDLRKKLTELFDNKIGDFDPQKR